MANKSFPTSSKNESEINEPHSSFNFDKRPPLGDHPKSKRSDHEDGRRTNQPQNDRQEMAPENDKRPSFGDKDLNLPEKPGENTITDGPNDFSDDVYYPSSAKQWIVSLNQEDGNDQPHFLRVGFDEVDGKNNYIVRADGSKRSDETIWRTHVTDLADGRKIAILENVGRSTNQEGKCVLSVQQDELGQYHLTAMTIQEIPKNLKTTPKCIQFYQMPKATGSAMVYFESVLGTKDRRLLVGFDSEGKPMPLEEVPLHSKYHEAYFKMYTVDLHR